MSVLAALVRDLSAQQNMNVENLFLGGSLGPTLTAVAVVRDLSKLADVDESIETVDGLRIRLEILFSAAAKGVGVTEGSADDEILATLRREVMQPEVLAFGAYLIRRRKSPPPFVL